MKLHNKLNFIRIGGIERIRTSDLAFRKRLLYPTELRAHILEAPPRFELGIEVLQTSALPLGYSARNWWPIQESNQGHEDFQSSALPTELTGHMKITWRRPALPQGYPCSTIGALKLNLRVRNGNECYLQAIITRYTFLRQQNMLH